jgi:hypothetical protein
MIDEFVYLVAEGNEKKYKDGWSKWRTPEDWAKEMKARPNYETIRPEKHVMETDYEKPETNKEVMLHVKRMLDEKDTAYKIYFTGNKSYHCESIWPELAAIPFEKRPRAKALLAEWLTNKELAKDFDEANYKNKRMLQMPGKPHRKTGSIKTLVWEKAGKNTMPEEIIKAAQKEPKTTQKNYPIHAPNRCLFLEWACENELPVSCRNQNLVPNLVAYTQDRGIWQKCADVQEKQLSEFENWAARQPTPKFNCWQLKKYSEQIDMGHLCELCGGVKFGRKN